MEEQAKNRVKVNIAGTKFTVVSAEDEAYTLKVADRLNEEIKTVRQAAPGLSVSSAVLLTALNICDNLTKAEEDAERLRRQVKEYLAESEKYRSAYEEAKTENEKLRRDMEIYRKRLSEKGRTAEPAPISPAVKAVHRSGTDEAADESAQTISFLGGKKPE